MLRWPVSFLHSRAVVGLETYAARSKTPDDRCPPFQFFSFYFSRGQALVVLFEAIIRFSGFHTPDPLAPE
jgi:hypothetical protein